jgi:hypothetical protein
MVGKTGRTGLEPATSGVTGQHSNQLNYRPWAEQAGWTGLEPATSGVTGQHSNQLNYHPEFISPREGGMGAPGIEPGTYCL